MCVITHNNQHTIPSCAITHKCFIWKLYCERNIQTYLIDIKSFTKRTRVSLDKTAQETGVSKAMLGQIEREESSPTIATLWKIATGFQTSFSTFIEDLPMKTSETLYRTGSAQMLHPNDSKIRVLSLFPFDEALHFEMFINELLPGCEHLSPPHGEGVIEHVVVVDGAMEVLVHDVWQPLKKGEGLRFNANQTHGYRNTQSELVRFHDIIHYPH